MKSLNGKSFLKGVSGDLVGKSDRLAEVRNAVSNNLLRANFVAQETQYAIAA